MDFASESLIEEMTSSYWASAHWARYWSIWTGRVLEEEKSSELKSERTEAYWPWTKAVWMFTSSPSVLKGSMLSSGKGGCLLGWGYRLEWELLLELVALSVFDGA